MSQPVLIRSDVGLAYTDKLLAISILHDVLQLPMCWVNLKPVIPLSLVAI